MSHTRNLSIRQANNQDVLSLCELSEALGKGDDSDYFKRCLQLQAEGRRILYIVSTQGRDAGYGILNWRPKYAPFKSLHIPEIQDLNVIPDFRRQGLASALIKHCELLAKEKGHSLMGIGVGLHYSYGPAQKLYIKLGYVPDGHGVNYDRKQVAFGDFRPVDDDLCLMLVKVL